MTEEFEKLGKELRQNGHPAIGALVRFEGKVAGWLGVPKSFPVPENGKRPEEINLEAEWQRQAQNLAKHFAQELKFETPEEYIATLPAFEPQPKEWVGRLDIPVIVETRVPLRRMIELAGIRLTFASLYGTTKDKENKKNVKIVSKIRGLERRSF